MKRLLFSIVLILCGLGLRAQSTFELGLHGGAAGWNSRHTYISMQPGANVGLHAAYGYYSQHVIGFRIGVTADMHRAGWSKTDYTDTYTTIDVESQTMQIDYTIGSLHEMYTTWSVGIPVQIALKWKNVGFYLGPKVVFPISCSWTEKAQNASLSVYYPDYDNRVYDSYPLAASQDFAMTNEGKLQLPKIQWWLATELNYTIPLNSWARNYRSYLIVGVYFDYCLTKYKPSQSYTESLIILTDTRDGFPLQRILTPIMEANRQGRKLVTDGSLFDVGIKISYTISPYNPHRRSSHSCNCL